jgi:hypothetical protein
MKKLIVFSLLGTPFLDVTVDTPPCEPTPPGDPTPTPVAKTVEVDGLAYTTGTPEVLDFRIAVTATIGEDGTYPTIETSIEDPATGERLPLSSVAGRAVWPLSFTGGLLNGSRLVWVTATYTDGTQVSTSKDIFPFSGG